MTDLSLVDAWAKLRWAWYHFERLRVEVESFDDINPYVVHCHPDDDMTGYQLYVDHLPDIPRNFGLRIGDCVHATRTALDYLMVRLVSLEAGKPPREIEGVQFPIYNDPGKFKGAVSGLRGIQIANGHLTRIEELQPYNSEDASIWADVAMVPAMLDRLSVLDNIDKHRVLNPTWHMAHFTARMLSELPGEIERVHRREEPAQPDTYIGCVHFTGPVDWKPTHMEMKRLVSMKVAIQNPDGLQDVAGSLRGCIWAVESVLNLFEPVFAHGRPPLPVTAIDQWLGVEGEYSPTFPNAGSTAMG